MSVPIGWRSVPLGEVLSRITYGFTNPMPTTDDGPFMVTAKDVRSGRIDYATSRRTSLEAFHDLLTDKSRPNVGDVLLTKDGSIGRVAVVDRSDVCINQSVALLQPSTQIDSHYLGYLLQAPAYQARMAADASGSTIKHIYITRVDKMSIDLPPLEEQNQIAELLRTFDRKIAVNERILVTIPAMIRTLVNKALEGGREIPVSGLAEFVNGGAFTKGASGSGRMVVRIAELNSGPGLSTVYNDIAVSDDRLVRAGDILMSWSGSLGVYRWFRDEAIVNQHIFKALPREGIPTWLVYDRLDLVMPVFQGIAKDKATTMGHIQRRHLETTTVGVPGNAAIAELDRTVSPLWRRLLLAELENLKLATLRDALVPELITGRVRVVDALEAVG